MSVLVLAELDENGIVPQTRNAVTAAAEIDSDVHLLVAGQDCGALQTLVPKFGVRQSAES